MKNCSKRAAWVGVSCGIVACAVFAFFGIANVWPPLDGDAPAYFAPAVELARGNAFENTVWLPPLNDSIDGPGGRRYIYHGFLHPLVVGGFAGLTGTDVPGCVVAAYVVLLVAAGLSGVAVVSFWRTATRFHTLAQFAVGFLAVTTAFACGFAWFGRMEPMVMLWIALGATALAYFPRPWSMSIGGACVMLTGLTSPVSGLMAGFLLLGTLLVAQPRLRAMDFLLIAAGGAIAGTICFAFYPFTVGDWLGGVARHSRINLGLPPFQGFFATWLARPHLPLLVVSFAVLATLALSVFLSKVRQSPRGQLLLSVGCIVIFSMILFRVALVKSEAAYNAVVWLPLLAAVAAVRMDRLAVYAVVFLALSLPTLGLMRSSFLLSHQVLQGPSYSEVRELAARCLPDGLALSSGLFLASPDLRATRFGAPDEAAVDGPRFFLEQQLASGRSEPKVREGYELIENRFGGAVEIFGIPVSRAPTGWQYALYRRIGADAGDPSP